MGREAHVVIKLIIKHQADFIRCKSGQKHRFGGKELFSDNFGETAEGEFNGRKDRRRDRRRRRQRRN